MIVCVCRNINDREVRRAAQNGAKRAKDVHAFHGCNFDCGTCKPMIQEILNDHILKTARPSGLKTNTIFDAAKTAITGSGNKPSTASA